MAHDVPQKGLKMTMTTLILQSGGSVQLQNAFIMGNGVAGDIAGECRRFADEDIVQVIESARQ